MADCVVLREKLRIPEVSGLARARLEQPLLAGQQTIVDMVVAPAGCGKSTLLSRVAAASAVPVGWYRVTADDSTEHRLVAHLGTALSAIADTAGAGSLTEVLEALDTPGGSGGMLILDDVHEIADTPAERALERFLSLRPRRLQLICGSRRMPDINVPRIRVSGSIRETGSDDLRFRSWEVEELFASVYGEPLRPEAAAALTRRTGGWAAGLQLFHLATVGRSTAERHQAVAALGGRSKLVRAYLTRNVLAELPAQRRAFLLRTCTLGRLSGEACDALLDTHGSHRILEELETAQLFTFTDDGGVYFRYHEVLQAHLELALVEEYGPAEAKACYRKSARVLESLGEPQQAARAYAKAGDWASVSRLVQDAGGVRLDATVVDDAHLLPAGMWQHDPWLALANARRLVREGALARAADAYRNAQKLYDDPNYQTMCRFEARAVSAWLPAEDRAPSAPPVAHWSDALGAALRRSPEISGVVCNGGARDRLVHGLAALAAGELRCARDILGAIGGDVPADPLARIVASLTLAALDLIDGCAADPAARFSTIAIDADNVGLPWVSRICHGLEQVALVVSTDAVWRLDSCSDFAGAAEQLGDLWGAGLLRWVIGVVRQRMGQDAAAELSSAEAVFEDLGAPVLQLWCRVMAARSGDPSIVKMVQTCRTLRVRGAQAVVLAKQGDPDAVEVLRQCGIPLSVTTSGSMDEPRSAVVAATEVVEASLPPVAITCFGGYRIAIDGEVADLSSLRPQARSVLQILSLEPDRDHHRETLEDILWPGVDHSVACHRLQVSVSSVRTMFGDTGLSIVRSGESYRLCLPARATVDVRDFADALARAAAASARGDLRGRVAARQEALDLYTGELLPEFSGSSAVDAERQRLNLAAAGAAAGLASDYRTLGEFERALAVAQRSVQLDPYQDSAWLVLTDVHTTLGDDSAAEYVRREHARLRADLEVSVL